MFYLVCDVKGVSFAARARCSSGGLSLDCAVGEGTYACSNVYTYASDVAVLSARERVCWGCAILKNDVVLVFFGEHVFGYHTLYKFTFRPATRPIFA